MMTVRPTYRRNKINSLMVRNLKQEFKPKKVIFVNTTKMGKSFEGSGKYAKGGGLDEDKNMPQVKKGDKIVVYGANEGVITNVLKTRYGTMSYKWKMDTAPNQDQFRLYEFDYGKKWVLKNS
jgi:hypothetical protein